MATQKSEFAEEVELGELMPTTSLELLDRMLAIIDGAREHGSGAVKDVLVRENEPVRATVPGEFGGEFVELAPHVCKRWSREEIKLFFDHLCPGWDEMIHRGAIDRPIGLGNVRYRVNMFTFGGEFSSIGAIGFNGRLGMCVRVFREEIPDLRRLGLPQKIAGISESKTGLLIVTGPVGNGKTTTCASYIDYINTTRSGHIVTIEDPIEILYTSKGCVITQRELGSNVESMARGAYDAMRELPEAILIGEVRERDAAEAAVYTGNAGQLVIGSMHANNAVASISKLVQFFPGQEIAKAEEVAACLHGVISQILVPNADKRSWVPIFETLYLSDRARDLISKRKWSELQGYLDDPANDGCTSRNESLAKAVQERKISKEVALRHSLNRSSLNERLSRLS